jgi:C4-dicarboxylate transporter DctM subunit
MEILSFLVALFGALFIGVPIAFAIAFSAFLLLFLFSQSIPMEAMLVILSQRMFTGTDSFPLLAIPLFFLAGNIMDGGGLSARLIRLADAVIGWMRGGLSMVVVLAEMFLAAISGSPSAVAAAIGTVMIPELKERGYDPRFAAAVVATGGCVGPIIPPSIMLVVFGSLANTSIADLFLGGMIPGILIGFLLMCICYFVSRLRNYPKGYAFSFKALGANLKKATLPLAAPVIILGGIFSGAFTPTESAMVAVAYAIVVSKFIYRSLTWKMIYDIFYDSALGSSRIMFIIAMASFVGWVLASLQIPQDIANYVMGLSSDPIIILILINLIFIIFGCFVEGIALMIILLPTLLPLVETAGIDMTLFGVMIVINLAIGTVTPPVGTCLIITSMISNIPIQQIYREIVPFILVILFVLLLTIFVPEIVTFLPDYFSD